MKKEEYISNNKKIQDEIKDLKKLQEELKEKYINSEAKRLNIEIGKQYLYKNIKVWIYELKIDFTNDLSCCIKKVKEDGTNGDSIKDSYGVSSDLLKALR